MIRIGGIERRLDAVSELFGNERLRGDLRESLKDVGDIERIMSKVCCGRATPRDIGVLRNSLKSVHPIRTHLDGTKSDLLKELATGLPDLSEVEALIDRTLADDPPMQVADGGVIRAGVHAELDELRDAASGGREWVAGLQTREREATGIPSLKVSYNKAFGSVIVPQCRAGGRFSFNHYKIGASIDSCVDLFCRASGNGHSPNFSVFNRRCLSCAL